VDLEVFHRGYDKEVKISRNAILVEPNTPVILSSRHMIPVYMIENIINAMPYVMKSHPNVTFVFVKGSGSSVFEKEMMLRAIELGVSGNIRFISRLLTPVEMAVYYNMADAVISIPKYGQFGASILEGMICGATIIASDIPVHREVLRNGENALLVDADDPKEIAEAIVQCIEHPEMKQQFYKINRKIIEESWNWQRNAGKMRRIYEKLLKEG
jgi:glycosyltransferase involved in cell wall biosynthesis